jgi:hypothetical protein
MNGLLEHYHRKSQEMQPSQGFRQALGVNISMFEERGRDDRPKKSSTLPY